VKLLLWGAGGHAKVVLDIALAMRAFTDICFADDSPEKQGHSFRGLPVISGSRLSGWSGGFLIAIGDNRIRAARYRAAAAAGLSAVTLVHPSAIISPSAAIGEGTVVMPGAVINADARVGSNCIINTGSVVEHECIVGDHAHIAPRVALGGAVKVGDFALIGSGAVALPGAFIGESAIVGAGAVVLEGAPAWATVAGVPAKIVRRAA
jgi:sugar O-acyltransferase (sialic acid O-acetyltransferase NeuD family)